MPGKARVTRGSACLSARLPRARELALEITVTDGTLTSTFTQTITREAAAEPGKVYLLTGPHYLGTEPSWPPESAWADGFNRQSLQAGNESNYGFLLSTNRVGSGTTCAAGTVFLHPRVCPVRPVRCRGGLCAGGHTLAVACVAVSQHRTRTCRGEIDSERRRARQHPLATRGVAGAVATIVRNLWILPGAITGLDARGVPALSQWLGPDGSTLWLRRKEPSRGPLGLTVR